MQCWPGHPTKNNKYNAAFCRYTVYCIGGDPAYRIPGSVTRKTFDNLFLGPQPAWWWWAGAVWAAGLLARTIHLSVIIFLSEFLSQRPMIARFFCRAELVASSQSWIAILYLRLCPALTRPGAALLPRPLPRPRTRPVRRRVRGGAARCRICEYFYHTNTLHTLQIPTNQCHDLNWYLQSSKLSI